MTKENLLLINEEYLAEVVVTKGEESKVVTVDVMLLLDKCIKDSNQGVISHIEDCVEQELASRGLEGYDLELSHVKDMWEKIINEKDHSEIIWSAKAIKKFNENLAKANEISKNFGVSIEDARKAVEYLTK